MRSNVLSAAILTCLPLTAFTPLTARAAPASDGVHFSFSVSGDTLASFVDGVDADLDCHGHLSSPAREAWQEVVREGENGASRFRDEHDRSVTFRREGDAFRIVTRDDEGRHVRVEIPWGMARCVIGGEEPAEGTARRLRGQEVRFDLEVDDDQVELVLASTPH